MADFHRGFEDIDRSSQEQAFFRFLDLADSLPSVTAYRNRMLELCPVTKGCTVLDVGCGLGSECVRIVDFVGQTGRVIGIDISQSMILEARRRTGELGLPLTFEIGDAHSLPFEGESFDLIRAERVLLYLDAPDKAIAEMARVTRSGGHLVIFDLDYGTFFIDSDFDTMTRRIEALVASDPRNPAMARSLPHLMRKTGLAIDAIEPMVLRPTVEIARRIYAGPISKGIENRDISAEEVDAWWREQEFMERSGKLYHAFGGYVVAATKP